MISKRALKRYIDKAVAKAIRRRNDSDETKMIRKLIARFRNVAKQYSMRSGAVHEANRYLANALYRATVGADPYRNAYNAATELEFAKNNLINAAKEGYAIDHNAGMIIESLAMGAKKVLKRLENIALEGAIKAREQ